jgi:hypothetical protein
VLKLVNDRTLIFDTIAGGAVAWENEARSDVGLASLWHHDSVKTALPREYRAGLIREASEAMMRGSS